ncbi:ABC transporter family substrate-binding protein [Nocardia sp. NBC_01377]|uniref:ABC transporter family substrate-binding protein n=1 Tax=Nocardia sp. NBC_01377 TaxID=2903595 RepID=UPI003244440D
MRIRSLGLRLIIPATAVGLVVAGCSADSSVTAGSGAIGTTVDINPHDVSELRQGGNLRLQITGFPETFNSLHVDTDGDASEVVGWTLPGTINSTASGELPIDRNYYTDIQLTGTEPQQITYTINPKAVWTDGTPITWEDLASQANALSGRDNAFRATTATPQAFNDLDRNGLHASAGPFVITSIDRAQQRIVLGRNPEWWGDTPVLDTVTYSVLDSSARLSALQNNELDSASISGIDEVTTASGSPGLVVRRAPSLNFTHMTFNGAPGSILEDPRLRVAVSKGIDRQGIATALLNGVVQDPKPLDNHLYLNGQKGYRNNAQSVAYDPDQAAKELDELGWKLNGDVREKDGRKLVIRNVMFQAETWNQVAQIAQQNLAAIGVKLDIQTYPGNGLFTQIIDPGNFDIANFVWSKSIFPLGALPQIYAYDPNNLQGNKGRIGSPELNALIEEIISELDPDKAIEMANEADKMIFAEGFSLPLYQSAGTIAQRADLANWGAFGLQSADFTKVGFLK